MGISRYTMYKYLKVDGTWSHCNAADHDNGKIKLDISFSECAAGLFEKHAEGRGYNELNRLTGAISKNTPTPLVAHLFIPGYGENIAMLVRDGAKFTSSLRSSIPSTAAMRKNQRAHVKIFASAPGPSVPPRPSCPCKTLRNRGPVREDHRRSCPSIR